MFWGVVRTGLFWAGVEPFNGGAWLLHDYFADPYVAALALGLVVDRWATIWFAPLGAVASLIVTVGERATVDEAWYQEGAEWSAYVEATLPWLWVAGLIALGIAVSRRVGGVHFTSSRDEVR